MNFPDISPIALEIGPLVIRWYALAYVVGILMAYKIVTWLDDRRSAPLLTQAARDDLILYAVLGIILGGRVGYVLFYNLDHFLAHPSQMAAVWQGGMSFHGGLIGVLAAFHLFARRYHISWLALMDRFAVAAPIGLFLGRCANFINGELYGRVTDAPWGVIFPQGGPLPRHPSQLYEAALEGILLFVLLFTLATRTNALARRGMLGGLFLIGYALSRFTVEFFREPDAQLGFLTFGLTMGQLPCLPMIAVGLWAVRKSFKNPSFPS